ncbi:MAG: DNA polymerase III subunit beta [Magnetococcales bacterium]|nr:DNA polymerase III subunit beta [Magnetococcales bacterium]MBF0440046.1 DNA polymerase III subunit beta [Magnetococcales bacterium]
MEFFIDRDPFLKVLKRIQTVVERRNTMPILGNALLEVTDNLLTVSATDLEVSLRTFTPVEVVEPGSLTVGARILFDVVNELPAKVIRLRQEGERLLLTCDRARFDLASLPGEQFPKIPQPEGEFHLNLSCDMLAEMLEKTHFAMSNDETRYVLNGVFMQLVEAEVEGLTGRIRLVATDTHRMAMVERPVECVIPETRDVIIPKKTVYEIRKLLEEDDQMVAVVLGPGFFQVIKPDLALISKVVQGRFPDWRRVMPTDNTIRLSIAREAFHQVVKRMSALSHEKSLGVRLLIEETRMRIVSVNPEQEEAEEEMAVSFDGENPITIGFNARYLKEILMAVSGETVQFALKDDESPVLVYDPERSDAMFVLMPMRV